MIWCKTEIAKLYANGKLLVQHESLEISIDKINVMLIGNKAQLKTLNVDGFIFSYHDTPLELVENTKFLGMFINSDISWEFYLRPLWQTTYCHIS